MDPPIMKIEQNVALECVKSHPSDQTDLYIITEIKVEEESETDFSLTGNQFVGESGAQVECVKQIHYGELSVDKRENLPDSDGYKKDPDKCADYVCERCFSSFQLKRAFKRHINHCMFNNKMILRREEMLRNIEQIEEEAIIMEKNDMCFCCGESNDTCHMGALKCTECPKCFNTQFILERHMFLVHSENQDFPCTICNARIRTESLLKFHIEQHKKRGKPFACKSCGKDFTRHYHLTRHKKTLSCGNGPAKMMQCKVCRKGFSRLDNLRGHLKTHLDQGTKGKIKYTCTSCKKCFYSMHCLTVHIRTHTGERPFNCDLCDKNFTSLIGLKKHRRSHTGEKPFSCEVCGKNFAVKESVNRHMKRHTGERPHVCIHCNKRFIQAWQLRKHLLTHNSPFECTKCPEKFKTEKQFEVHFKESHFSSSCLTTPKNRKSVNAPSVEKSHSIQRIRNTSNKCEDCNFVFSSRRSLKKHEKSAKHIEHAAKFCFECGLKCASLKALKMHMLEEHKDSEYVCKTCCVAFDKYELLHDHIKSVHDNKYPYPDVFQDEKTFKMETVKEEQDDCVRLFTKTEVQDNEVSPELKTTTKDRHRAELKNSLSKCFQEKSAKKVTQNILSAEDVKINTNVWKLLNMLVDVETLSKFGWPEETIENVLCKVIENCGHNLDRRKFTENYSIRMKELVKLLFIVVIQNDSINELLNSYPIDEVIELVLSNDE